eukprot:1760626-Rhodomonas_salina.1
MTMYLVLYPGNRVPGIWIRPKKNRLCPTVGHLFGSIVPNSQISSTNLRDSYQLSSMRARFCIQKLNTEKSEPLFLGIPMPYRDPKVGQSCASSFLLLPAVNVLSAKIIIMAAIQRTIAFGGTIHS